MLPTILPMLAYNKPAPHSCFEDEDYWMQEKLDGERRLFHLGTETFLTGRKFLKSGDISEISQKVPHLISSDFSDYEGTILDGELLHTKGFQTLSRIVRCNLEKALQRQQEEGFLTYHAYDILSYHGVDVKDLPYRQRHDLLQYVLTHIPDEVSSYIISVPSYKTEEEKESVYEMILRDATKEGVMFRKSDASYELNKRSKSLLRLKKELTEDVIITDIGPGEYLYGGSYLDKWTYWHNPYTQERYEGTQPSGHWFPVTHDFFYGLPAIFYFAQYDKQMNLIDLGACSGFSREIAMDMKNYPERWLGAVVEIKANERFSDTLAFRHPRFLRRRDDKNPSDCKIPTD